MIQHRAEEPSQAALDEFERLLNKSSLTVKNSPQQTDQAARDLINALTAARNEYAHRGDGSALMALAGLLERAGDYATAESFYRLIARDALQRLADLHERHGQPDDARRWAKRAATLEGDDVSEPSPGRRKVVGRPSGKSDVGPPPRVVMPDTQVEGHRVVTGAARTFCSCGWRAGTPDQPTTADHLRDAWPLIAPRLEHESLADWRQRLLRLLREATDEERRLWDKHKMGNPIGPGEPFPILQEDYADADDRVAVLTWQLEELSRAQTQT